MKWAEGGGTGEFQPQPCDEGRDAAAHSCAAARQPGRDRLAHSRQAEQPVRPTPLPSVGQRLARRKRKSSEQTPTATTRQSVTVLTWSAQ